MKTIIIIEHHPDLTATPIDDFDLENFLADKVTEIPIIMQNPVGKWWLIRWPSTEAQAQADLF